MDNSQINVNQDEAELKGLKIKKSMKQEFVKNEILIANKETKEENIKGELNLNNKSTKRPPTKVCTCMG